jgi:RNA polymerase sigma-70 factor (ECF subfamily)
MMKISPARGEDYQSQLFEEIYERQFSMVYRVCFSYMKNKADTDDVVADVFTKLLKSGTTFKSAEHEKAWLLRTAINKCKDYLKHWWHSRADIADYEYLETANPFQESELSKAILKLPERYKAVIYLYYYEGYSTLEVAQILKKPQSTIFYHMREARKLLKGVLENEE